MHSNPHRPARPVRRHLVAGALVVVTAGSLAALAIPASTAASPPGTAVQADAVVQPTVVSPAVPRLVPLRATRTRPTVRYVKRTVPVGAAFSGNASWYGGSFQGRRTANGERFDTSELTAASKTLPFGTRLRVCRRSRCVVVRINDRGPFVRGRVLDLSRAASRQLGYSGVAYVTATPIGTRRVAVPVTPPAPVRPVVRAAAVQAASPLPVAALPEPVLAASSRPVSRPVAALVALSGAGALVLVRRRWARS